MKKETQCVHSGTIEDNIFAGVVSPIYTSTAFGYLDRETVCYPRYFNTPNQNAVIAKVCALEGAEDGVLFSSGMAAISSAILAYAGSGDHVVMMDELYGGTHSFATDQLQRLGIDYTFAATDADSISRAVNNKTRLVVIESPTNPLLSVIDIRKVASFCRNKNVISIIDNTFATPLYQNPITLGVDIVVHSGTKYLGGHSDINCGIAVASKEHAARIRKVALSLGGSLNAETCSLLERSIKTLALRVERQTSNAGILARMLEQRQNIKKVYYPGLSSSSHHDLAKSQMSGFGPMLSFELQGSKVDADRFVRSLRIIKPAVSLGGIESTICAPSVTSHAGISAEERKRIGISDSLLRLSVGIEQVDDLIEDIEHAVKR